MVKLLRKHNSRNEFASTALCFLAAAAVLAGAIAWFQRTGATLYFGDAEAHLDIARRIVDSRTPGWSQVGTTWLPLPHLSDDSAGPERLAVANGPRRRHHVRPAMALAADISLRRGAPDFREHHRRGRGRESCFC